MASRTSAKVDRARVFVIWDEPKKLALIDALEERPFYCSLFFSDNAHLKRYDIPRSEAIFDLSVEFLARTDPLWFADMEARGLMTRDVNGEWAKTELWAINKTDQGLPTYRQVKITQYRASIEEGVEDSWTSWDDVKKANKARHDGLKKQNPYYFLMRKRKLYKLAEANPPVALDPHKLVSKKTLTPRTSYSPSSTSISHIEIPTRSPTAANARKWESGAKTQVKMEVDFSPSRPHSPAQKPPMPTFTKYKLAQGAKAAAPIRPQSTLRVSTAEIRTASPVSPAASDHSDISLEDDFADAPPPYHAGGSYTQPPAPSATTRPIKPCPTSPRRKAAAMPTPLNSHTPTPATKPLPPLAAPTGPRARQSVHTTVGSKIPRPAPPAAPHGRSSTATSLPTQTAGSVHQPIAPSTPSTSGAPGGTTGQGPAVIPINWRQPIFTTILLEALQTDPRLRSTLLPSLFPASADNPLREKWKTERDLYLKMMVQEPGQAWLTKAKEWKWVGEKPGTSLLKATVLWPNTAVYGFVERLDVLSASWKCGDFETEFVDRGVTGPGTPDWSVIMTTLFGPPGVAVMSQPEDVTPAARLPAPTEPTTRPSFYTYSHKRPRLSQAAPAPRRLIETAGSSSARPTEPISRDFALPPKPESLEPPAADRQYRPDADTRTRKDFLAMIQLANYRKFHVSDLSSKRRKEYELAVDTRVKNEIFELGRVEIYAEGLIGCASLVTSFKRPRTYDNVAFNTNMIPCLLVRNSIQDLIQITGGIRVDVDEIETMNYRPGDHRFQVYLFRDRSGASLLEQLNLVDGHVLRVGLLEYLQYVGQRIM